MGKYFVDIADNAKEDMRFWHKVGDESVIEKIKKLLIELSEHPKTGTGRPERLKGNLAGCWSRRISGKHRMVYEIDDGTVTVVVLYLRGHYGDS